MLDPFPALNLQYSVSGIVNLTLFVYCLQKKERDGKGHIRLVSAKLSSKGFQHVKQIVEKTERKGKSFHLSRFNCLYNIPRDVATKALEKLASSELTSTDWEVFRLSVEKDKRERNKLKVCFVFDIVECTFNIKLVLETL